MYTYEMFGVANDNSKTYTSLYGEYSRKDGFVLNEKGEKELADNPEKFLYDFLDKDLWMIKVQPKQMTQDEIEKALGYKIEIINNDKEKNNISHNQYIKKVYDENELEKLFDMLWGTYDK